jgi:BirA family biotin operon repressor/biotin-[acetyl-CoA-carboxylase] ligase
MEIHRHFAECASTNDLARDWARDPEQPASEGAVVTADFQTLGRGRRGRSWQSVPGENLLMSVVLRPPYPIAEAWKLGFVTALAVADAVAEHAVSPQLKWPNDVLIEGCKVSGVLIETTVDPVRPEQWAAIVGVGVNINQTAFDDPLLFDVHPISLRMACGDEIDVALVAERIHRCLLARELEHREKGFSSIAALWRERMAMGFEIKRGASRGIQTHLTDDGYIQARLPDGTFALWGTIEA